MTICNISVIIMPLNFSTPKVEVERHLSIVFKLLKENYINTEILCPAKLSIKYMNRITILSHMDS